jgi:hypothetical protein
VVVIERVGEHDYSAEVFTQGALHDAPASSSAVGVAAVHSFGGKDFAVIAVPFGGGAPAEAAVAIGEEGDGVEGDGRKGDCKVEVIEVCVDGENGYFQTIVEENFLRPVLVKSDMLLKDLKFLGTQLF